MPILRDAEAAIPTPVTPALAGGEFGRQLTPEALQEHGVPPEEAAGISGISEAFESAAAPAAPSMFTQATFTAATREQLNAISGGVIGLRDQLMQQGQPPEAIAQNLFHMLLQQGVRQETAQAVAARLAGLGA
jgi:hypothetical protein